MKEADRGVKMLANTRIPGIPTRAHRYSGAVAIAAGLLLILTAFVPPAAAQRNPQRAKSLIRPNSSASAPGVHANGIALPAAATAAGQSTLLGVGCSSPGNCVGGGWYISNGSGQQALEVTQIAGTWQQGARVSSPSDAAGD